jgi:hypothetical protein
MKKGRKISVADMSWGRWFMNSVHELGATYHQLEKDLGSSKTKH